jgi:hypothetical protein
MSVLFSHWSYLYTRITDYIELAIICMTLLNKSLKLILRKKPSKIYCTHGGSFEPKAVLRRFS